MQNAFTEANDAHKRGVSLPLSAFNCTRTNQQGLLNCEVKYGKNLKEAHKGKREEDMEKIN